ncbi:hypothetical protein S245_020815 [Arachis hypogaea]
MLSTQRPLKTLDLELDDDDDATVTLGLGLSLSLRVELAVFTLVTQPQPLSLSFSVQPPPCYRRRRNFKATIKEFPKKLLLELHPSDFDVLFIHLMFGPEFAPNGWTGLLFIFEKVRILDKEHRVSRGEKFLNRFAREGCRMMEMICEDHDHYAAGLQFITHTVGRSFKGLMLESMPINMKRYESLLELGENTVGDSFDLYYGLFMFNKNFLEVLEKLDLAFGNLRKQLIAWMHHVVRNQLMENVKDCSSWMEVTTIHYSGELIMDLHCCIPDPMMLLC